MVQMKPVTLGDRVRARRRELGLRQEDIAAATGLSYPTIGRIERGDDPSLGTLLVLADALQTTVGALLGETNSVSTRS